MPSHVPRTAPIKQQETLAKREARLRHAIATFADADAIKRAAEHLRQSQLSILKARREILRYKKESDEMAREVASIAADEELWRELSVEAIAIRYSDLTGA
jgi:hypothetical protein